MYVCFLPVTAASFQNERNNNNIFFRRLIERSLQNARNVYKFFGEQFGLFQKFVQLKEGERHRERGRDKQMIEAGEVGSASKDCSQN